MYVEHSLEPIVSYNANAVKFYNATSSLVRFKNTKIYSGKKLYVVYYSAGVVVVNSEVKGLAPGMKLHMYQGVKIPIRVSLRETDLNVFKGEIHIRM
jgi:hypothetical protein